MDIPSYFFPSNPPHLMFIGTVNKFYKVLCSSGLEVKK
jgi:hypothetical protein